MSFRLTNSDPYLMMLLEQAKALDSREAELIQREQQLKEDRQAVAEDRSKLAVARQHYEAFLASKASPATQQMKFYDVGEPLPLTEEQRQAFLVPAAAPIPLPLRMGAKRRRVLDAVATAGEGQTNREISAKTGVLLDVVRNITAAEIKLGIFARHGDKLYMTPAGLDYLNRANEKFGPPQKEHPTAAGGVFQ